MITILAQAGPLLVEPTTVETAPYLIKAFIAGLAAPVGLWSILFIATVARKGHRIGGGITDVG